MGLDAAKRSQRRGAKRDDDFWIDERDRGGEVAAAVREFGAQRGAVPARGVERQAEDGIRDENFGTGEPGGSEEGFEAAPGLVAAEGHARASRAEASGGFADEQHARRDRAVHCSEHRAAVNARTAAAGAGGFEQMHAPDDRIRALEVFR